MHLLVGSPSGLSATGLRLVQGVGGIPDGDELGDGFGGSIRVLASSSSGAWLAIGAPWEDLGPISDAGAVTVVPGSSSGLNPSASQWWTQDSPGIKGGAEPGDAFG